MRVRQFDPFAPAAGHELRAAGDGAGQEDAGVASASRRLVGLRRRGGEASNNQGCDEQLCDAHHGAPFAPFRR
jgi:hypothetical protein